MRISTANKNNLSEVMIALLQRLVGMIAWPRRRLAQGDVTRTLLEGKERIAEETFGWSRVTVAKGMAELDSGTQDKGNASLRKKKKTEEKFPNLEADIHRLLDATTQADARLSNTLRYLDPSARIVREKLVESGYAESVLPTERTISNILNRLGYRLRSVEKAKPQKKNPETDMIFENVHRVNAMADANPYIERISVDVKAAVAIGEFSRNGKSRCLEPVKAIDHDMFIKEKMIPVGILSPATGQATVVFGDDRQTSDLIADAIEQWLEAHHSSFRARGVNELVINADNGPDCSGHRSQFLLRMIQLADKYKYKIHLAYYPPYHSKYNPIEHFWGGLERSWNGMLLDTKEAVLKRAGNFRWRGLNTIVGTLFGKYKDGIRHSAKEKKIVTIQNPHTM